MIYPYTLSASPLRVKTQNSTMNGDMEIAAQIAESDIQMMKTQHELLLETRATVNAQQNDKLHEEDVSESSEEEDDDLLLDDIEKQFNQRENNITKKYVKTENELVPEVKSVDIQLEEQVELIEIGKVLQVNKTDLSMIVLSTEGVPALDEDSVICLLDKSILGCIDEVFGPVKMPMYLIRFKHVVPDGVDKDVKVYHVPKHSKYVDMEKASEKGTDASNKFDEETEDKEYSDDEQEALAKKQLKRKNRKDTHVDRRRDNGTNARQYGNEPAYGYRQGAVGQYPSRDGYGQYPPREYHNTYDDRYAPRRDYQPPPHQGYSSYAARQQPGRYAPQDFPNAYGQNYARGEYGRNDAPQGYGRQYQPPPSYGGQYQPPQGYGGQYPPQHGYGGQYQPPQGYGREYPPQAYGRQYPPQQGYGREYPPQQGYGTDYPPQQTYGRQYPPRQAYDPDRPTGYESARHEDHNRDDSVGSHTGQGDAAANAGSTPSYDPRDPRYKPTEQN